MKSSEQIRVAGMKQRKPRNELDPTSGSRSLLFERVFWWEEKLFQFSSSPHTLFRISTTLFLALPSAEMIILKSFVLEKWFPIFFRKMGFFRDFLYFTFSRPQFPSHSQIWLDTRREKEIELGLGKYFNFQFLNRCFLVDFACVQVHLRDVESWRVARNAQLLCFFRKIRRSLLSFWLLEQIFTSLNHHRFRSCLTS